ncbi:TlpA family protein disulfide reductase [Sphingomonas bacterium]|uniref:TlpA family protein disulfide reductase n=1 Tax=Sphingomonas bacterium TaxID=1895847 RepID=UPI0015769599|nr:TlpA disulfide reductase family protein [Sphingomonas bacterium]
MSSRWAVVLLLGVAGCTRHEAAPEQANATAEAAAAPAAGIDRSHQGETLPGAALIGVDGKAARLPTGKPLVVNLWATWCAPCVAELPTLDRAAGELKGRLGVVALDQGDAPDKVQAFLAAKPLATVRPLIDRQLEVSVRLGANLPTTILYGADGKERWRVTGGRDWSTPASLKLLGEAG